MSAVDAAAVAAATSILERQRGISLSYTAFCDKMRQRGFDYDPHSYLLNALLDATSRASDQRAGVMLSVLVIHKDGDLRPGPGFFSLMKKLGRDVKDPDVAWIAELNRILDRYGRRAS